MPVVGHERVDLLDRQHADDNAHEIAVRKDRRRDEGRGAQARRNVSGEVLQHVWPGTPPPSITRLKARAAPGGGEGPALQAGAEIGPLGHRIDDGAAARVHQQDVLQRVGFHGPAEEGLEAPHRIVIGGKAGVRRWPVSSRDTPSVPTGLALRVT